MGLLSIVVINQEICKMCSYYLHAISSCVCVYACLWQDLAEFLEQIGFSKYLPLLEEQDIDLRIFLTLTENDLKEVGIT